MCVPLSDYDSCKPFMMAFDKHPCKEAEVENIFAPGLPLFLIVSSATSGRGPKFRPQHHCYMPTAFFDSPGLITAAIFYDYREVKKAEREPRQIVGRVPVTYVPAGVTRATLGWTNSDDDDSRNPLLSG